MFNTWIKNWRTTSAGLTLVITNGVHLVIAARAGTANENTWVLSLTGILTGVGFLVAGDAAQSSSQADTLAEQVKTAINTSDTSHITKPSEKKP